MTKPEQTIRVFIASPGDRAVELRAFKDVLDELNAGFGDGVIWLCGLNRPINVSRW